jgi:ribonuclease-3
MEEACDGRNNLRILGSAFEAWIGAMYLQEEEDGRGITACRDFLLKIIENHIDFIQMINEDTNYKDQLLRLFQARFHVPPRYKEVEVEGPPHDRIFTMGVLDPSDDVIARATARNKKVAEQEASRLALEVLMWRHAAPTPPAEDVEVRGQLLNRWQDIPPPTDGK